MILNYYNDLVFQPSNLFLNKDFGQVATVLGRIHQMRVVHMICCNTPNESLVEFSGNEVFQIRKNFQRLSDRLDFVKNGDALKFLRARRGKFKVLVMFPFCPPSDVVFAKWFLALNPGARIIMKLDANRDYLERLQQSFKAHPRSRMRQHHAYRQLLELADVVIYETRDAGALLQSGEFLGYDAREKFVNVYNGISQEQIAGVFEGAALPSEKQNLIVFSGRLGTPEKNTQLIFEADLVPEGWRLEFLGKSDARFDEVIAAYRAKDPSFDRKYGFSGEITDRRKYYEALSRGRILLLCSNKEGFPMVYSEAHYLGLYIVTTDVSGAREATDDGRLGEIVPRNDSAALRNAIRVATSKPSKALDLRTITDHGARRFVWEDSLRQPQIDAVFAPRPDALH